MINMGLGLMAIGFGVSFLLGYPVCAALKQAGVVDHPNARSSHERVTVRGGGVAIVAAIVVGGLLVFLRTRDMITVGMGAIMVMVSVLSFWDDLRSLGPAIRFGGHLLAALLALMLLGWSQLNMGMLGEDLVWPWGLLGVFLMILWVTGYINGFNFMDGINGIAAGQAAMTALGMGLISGWASGRWGSAPVLICFVIAGAALGFAPHNFPRARMFMGDVGSASLGFALAVLVLWLASDLGWKLFVPLVLLHANFVLDTGITLTRRVLQGERWYAPHREHFYQRLVRAGRGHTFVTLVEMGLQSLVLGLLTLYIEVEASGRLVIVVAVVVIWLIFFAWVETCFRKHMTNRGPTAHG